MALNLEGLSREEKKQTLREKIARMEEEEVDVELRDLLEWYSELQKRQQSKESVVNNKTVKASKNLKRSKIKDYISIENSDGSQSKLDVDTFMKKSLPSISDIQNLLHVTEKKPAKTK